MAPAIRPWPRSAVCGARGGNRRGVEDLRKAISGGRGEPVPVSRRASAHIGVGRGGLPDRVVAPSHAALILESNLCPEELCAPGGEGAAPLEQDAEEGHIRREGPAAPPAAGGPHDR